jgi:hypothetical protein
MPRKRTPKVCPVCGEDVPPKALSCPECGACHNSGWKEDADVYDGLDSPDDEFDYDDFVKREFGSGAANPASGNAIWWVTALVLLLILLAGALRLME